MSNDRWTPADMPDLSGTTAVVTGANSGIGFWTALELARHGAWVVVASRDSVRGGEALTRLRAQAPDARFDLRQLDLADLQSIRTFAGTLTGELDRLDLLVNNAGIMGIPRRVTADGFEMQLGTNHLGHFALTGLLLPLLLAVPPDGSRARVVTVSSTLHRRGRLNRDDLMLEAGYAPFRAYGQSKLANLLFVRELQRRADDAGARLASLAAHPGYAATNLQTAGPRMTNNPLMEKLYLAGNAVLSQSAEQGAWPSLRAGTDPQARPGEYFGPGSMLEQRGHPRRVAMSGQAMDPVDAAWLWRRSVELTGVDYSEIAFHSESNSVGSCY